MDFDRTFVDLEEWGHPWLVIGGLLRAHYAAGNTRPTFDVDVVVRPGDRESLVRHLYARGYRHLLRFEQKPWADPVIETEADVEAALARAATARGASFLRVAPAASLDVWFDLGVAFDELAADARPREIFGRRLPAVSAENWRRLKALAGRRKDLEDLDAFAPPRD